MRNLKKTIVPVLSVIAFSFAIISCSKDNININVGNEQGQDTYLSGGSDSTSTSSSTTIDSISSSGQKAKIFYDANVYTLFTKANSMTEIEAGRYVEVYVYNSTSTTLVTSELYLSSTGTLSPSSPSTTAMELVTGTYKLYTPGVNAPKGTAVPKFSTTTINGLSNGIDYVWTDKTIEVSGTSQNVTLNLQHECTQVVIVFLNSDGVTFNSAPTMSLTASTVTTSNEWNLITGVITPSTAVSTTYTTMAVAQSTSSSSSSTTTTTSEGVYYGQLTMMPLKLNGNMTAKFTATINNQSNDFQVTLPVYQDYLQAGNCYIYKVEFKNNEVTFTNTVNVVDWIQVDANSEPIIPTQIN